MLLDTRTVSSTSDGSHTDKAKTPPRIIREVQTVADTSSHLKFVSACSVVDCGMRVYILAIGESRNKKDARRAEFDLQGPGFSSLFFHFLFCMPAKKQEKMKRNAGKKKKTRKQMKRNANKKQTVECLMNVCSVSVQNVFTTNEMKGKGYHKEQSGLSIQVVTVYAQSSMCM